MRRNKSILFSVLLICVLPLAGCGWFGTPNPTTLPGQPNGTSGPTSPNEQPTPVVIQATPQPGITASPSSQTGTVTIWYQWGGAYLEASKQIFRDYQATHPGVVIQLVQPQNLHSILPGAIQNGQGPDIVEITNNQIGSLALAGNIADLGTLGVDQESLANLFEPAAVKAVTFQDKVWALPESEQGIALVYNTDMLTKDTAPKGGNDFNDLLAKAQDFANKNKGKYLVCNQGLGNPDAAAVAPIFFGFGVPTYVDDAGKVYLNTPQAIKAGEWMVNFVPYAPRNASYTNCMNQFINHQVAAIWTGPWAIPQIQSAGINFGIIPMGRPFVDVNVLMITKNAVDRGNAALALDIMQFYTNEANAEKLALAGKVVPVNSAALNSDAVKADPVLSGFGEALKAGVATGTTPYTNAQWGPVAGAAVDIWIGKLSPADALAAAQKAIQDAIGPVP